MKDHIKTLLFYLVVILLCMIIITIGSLLNNDINQVILYISVILFTSLFYRLLQIKSVDSKDEWVDASKDMYKIMKSASTVWFDILKWLLIVAAISFAISKVENDYYKTILYSILSVSYIFIYVYLFSMIARESLLFFDKIDAHSKSKIYPLFIFFIIFLSGILLGYLFSEITKVVELLPPH